MKNASLLEAQAEAPALFMLLTCSILDQGKSLKAYHSTTRPQNCQGTTFCTIDYFSSLTVCALTILNQNRYLRSKIYDAWVSRISNISATCCTRQTVQVGPSYRRMNVMSWWFTAVSSASSIQCGTLTDLWHMSYTSTTFHRTRAQHLSRRMSAKHSADTHTQAAVYIGAAGRFINCCTIFLAL
jgi:hypothetical protein